ncbi:MAG TPA: carbohydrate kinase [Blastocatellia bacterium]|nr:carbohydrate kinase [Blastocatellia bacterium]
MKTQRPEVAGLGEVLWDLLEQGRKLGGAPANFAYFASQLGARAMLVSRVGQDELGDETLRRLGDLGLGADAVTRDPEHETGKASVAVDAAGVPRFVIHEPAAWDFIAAPEGALDRLGKADAVCFGTLGRRHPVARASIRAMVESTPAAALRVFDINLRPPFYTAEVITEGLGLANVLKINEDELKVVSEIYGLAGDEVDRLRGLRDQFGLRLVAMTKGGEGSLIVADDQVSRHPGIPTEVKDTVGAGDAFAAALVMGLLRGGDLEALHARAARLASYVCSQAGATPPLPAELVAEWG